MKKYLLLTMLMLTFGVISNAQAIAMKGSGDSAVNSVTKICSSQLSGTSTAISVQVTRTKATGTIAGKVYIETSIDGVNWNITDSVSLTANVLVFGNSNTRLFIINNPKNIAYVRTRTVTTGTLKMYIRDVILQRKD